MPFRLWALAGSYMIDGMFRMQVPSGTLRTNDEPVPDTKRHTL